MHVEDNYVFKRKKKIIKLPIKHFQKQQQQNKRYFLILVNGDQNPRKNNWYITNTHILDAFFLETE